jgi:hypothetical protein
MLISPSKTLRSCGNSSRLERRSQRPDARDARIVSHLSENGFRSRIANFTGDVFPVSLAVNVFVRVGAHCAKFEAEKNAPVHSDALLSKQNRARRIEPNQNRNQNPDGRENNQWQSAKSGCRSAFDEAFGVRKRFAEKAAPSGARRFVRLRFFGAKD